jgi:hypothetical protein
LAVRSNAIALWPLGDRGQRRRQRRQEATLDVDKRHFSTLIADEKSKGFLAPDANEKSRFLPPDVSEKHFLTLSADGGSGRKSPFDLGRTSRQPLLPLLRHFLLLRGLSRPQLLCSAFSASSSPFPAAARSIVTSTTLLRLASGWQLSLAALSRLCTQPRPSPRRSLATWMSLS